MPKTSPNCQFLIIFHFETKFFLQTLQADINYSFMKSNFCTYILWEGKRSLANFMENRNHTREVESFEV